MTPADHSCNGNVRELEHSETGPFRDFPLVFQKYNRDRSWIVSFVCALDILERTSLSIIPR